MNSMKIITRVLITAFALLLVSHIVPGITVDGLFVAVVTALVIGLLNIFVKPILVLLTLPITILTLGLFMFVINALLLLFAASFIEGFAVKGFVSALLGSCIISVISAIANSYLTE